MSSGKKIVRNTTFLSIAFVGQKILSFIYFTLIARFVGVVDTGAYVYALSYSTIFSVFVDFGFAPFIQRQIALNPEETKKIVNHTLVIKLVYGLCVVIIGLGLIHVLVDDALIIKMVYIAMVLMLVDSFNLTVWSAFRGKHMLQFESLSIIISQIIVLIIGIIGLKSGWSLAILIIALLCGSVFTAIFSSIMARKYLGFIAFPRYDKSLGNRFIKEAIPFGLAGAFTRIFSSIDTVLLRQIAGGAAVGFYAVPNKIVFAVQFIPSAFSATIYPAMSHYFKADTTKMINIFEQAMLFLLTIAVPIAVGGFILTPILITDLFSHEFDASIPAMYILIWGLVFAFAEFPIGALLSAIGQQKKNTITRGIVMIMNIILNVILIPIYSFVGAAIAALISYGLLVIIGIYWANKFVSINWSKLIVSFCKIFVASTVMGVIVWIFRLDLHLTLLILLGAITYAVMVVLLKIVDFDQIKYLRQSFKN